MAAFLETSKVIDQVEAVRKLAWDQSTACARAGSGFQEICDDTGSLHWELGQLEQELADPKSFLKRCPHHIEVELRELIEECVQDLQDVEEFLSNLKQKRNSINSKDPDLDSLRKRVCERRIILREFRTQATTTALEVMKAQFFMLVEDIFSQRRSPYILTKIVDWDALAEELEHPIFAHRDSLEFADNGDTQSVDDGVDEVLDPLAVNSHSPSPEHPGKGFPQRPKETTYRAPTVEDCDGSEDDEIYSPKTVPRSSHSSDTAVDPNAHLPGANSSGSLNDHSNANAEEEDPMASPNWKPRRVDTELKLMQQEKHDIKEEIRKLRAQAKDLEDQKRAWEVEQSQREAEQSQKEAEQLQDFRDFCAKFTKVDEASILAECWRIPAQSFDRTTYFAMPNGTFYSAGVVQHKIKVPPTPPLRNAFRRGSSYASHNSGGGSGGGSAGMASPSRRDSSFFGGVPSHPLRDEWREHGSRVVESPREMSPASNDRTPTPSQPPPPPLPQQQPSPPLSPRPTRVVKHPLPVTLEEAFNGTQKKVRINREVFDAGLGIMRMETKDLSINIKKGLQPRSKIMYSCAGNQGRDGVAQDIWFIIEDEWHPLFKRSGSDLHTTVEITIGEAIGGWRKDIQTICRRRLTVKGPKGTPDRWKHTFPGFGMPKSRDPSVRGDLIVEVEIGRSENPGVV